MNRTEHLLIHVAEECVEVAQRATKAAKFGLKEVQSGQELNNEERILLELNDLFGVIELLMGCPIEGCIDRKLIEAKHKKVEKYLEYSRECGTLQ